MAKLHFYAFRTPFCSFSSPFSSSLLSIFLLYLLHSSTLRAAWGSMMMDDEAGVHND